MPQAKWTARPATVGIFFHKPNNLRFALSKQARHDMGYPAMVTVNYDKKRKVLTFSPCALSHPDGYAVALFGQVCAVGIIKRYELQPQRDILLVKTSADVWEATLE